MGCLGAYACPCGFRQAKVARRSSCHSPQRGDAMAAQGGGPARAGPEPWVCAERVRSPEGATQRRRRGRAARLCRPFRAWNTRFENPGFRVGSRRRSTLGCRCVAPRGEMADLETGLTRPCFLSLLRHLRDPGTDPLQVVAEHDQRPRPRPHHALRLGDERGQTASTPAGSTQPDRLRNPASLRTELAHRPAHPAADRQRKPALRLAQQRRPNIVANAARSRCLSARPLGRRTRPGSAETRSTARWSRNGTRISRRVGHAVGVAVAEQHVALVEALSCCEIAQTSSSPSSTASASASVGRQSRQRRCRRGSKPSASWRVGHAAAALEVELEQLPSVVNMSVSFSRTAGLRIGRGRATRRPRPRDPRSGRTIRPAAGRREARVSAEQFVAPLPGERDGNALRADGLGDDEDVQPVDRRLVEGVEPLDRGSLRIARR